MGLRDRFSEEMKTAMKAKDTKRLGAIRLMMADVQKQGIAAKNENLSDDEILAVLARMIKQREDSATAFESGGVRNWPPMSAAKSPSSANSCPSRCRKRKRAPP
jgi:uncharacterized protein YqeY